MVVAAAVFLRWLPHHGLFVGTLVLVATLTAAVLTVTRPRRFRRAVQAINEDLMRPGIHSTAALATSVVILSILGMYTVLVLPPTP